MPRWGLTQQGGAWRGGERAIGRAGVEGAEHGGWNLGGSDGSGRGGSRLCGLLGGLEVLLALLLDPEAEWRDEWLHGKELVGAAGYRGVLQAGLLPCRGQVVNAVP